MKGTRVKYSKRFLGRNNAKCGGTLENRRGTVMYEVDNSDIGQKQKAIRVRWDTGSEMILPISELDKA